MADRTVRVVLQAQVDGFVAAMGKASTATKKVAVESLRMEAQVARSARNHKAEWDQVGGSLLKVGAAAALGLGAVIKTSSDFERQMSNVRATGADAANNIDGLRQAAMDAGRAFGQFSAADAANGIEQLAKAGLTASQIMTGGLNGALALAAAGEMAVGDAAEVTAKTLAQFELKGSDASHVADLLAAGAGKAVGDVSDLGMAMAQAGTTANQYGVSVEETTGTLALFAQNALLGSDAGTSLKSMLLQLASPTKESQQTLDDLGISAYNANGEFVGMAGLADQLKDKLGGMSQAQQNAALKTIFGADAIRSAAILMREGGDGVRKWTDDVNDSGYAAQAAATRMDNLSGDLKALGGSWENFAITLGSGAQSPLRGAVQDLTAFVDELGNMPPAMQSVTLGALGVVAAGGLIGGAFMKGIPALIEFRDAQKVLSADMPKLNKALGTGTKAVLAYAAAVAILATAEQVFGTKGMTQGLTDSTTQMLAAADAASGLDEKIGGVAVASSVSTESLDKFFQSTTSDGQIVDGVDSLRDAFERLNPAMEQGWQKRRDAMDKFAKVVTFGAATTDTDKLTEAFSNMDSALSKLSQNGAADKAAGAFQLIAKEADAAHTPIDQLLKQFPEYKAQLQDQANQLELSGTGFKAASLTAQDYADWMGGKVPPAVQKAADAAQAAGKPVGHLATEMGATDEAAQQAADALAKLRQSYFDTANAALQLSGTQRGFEAAIDAVTDSVKKNGKTLDISTEAGRANRDALDGIASAGLSYVESMEKSGASTESLVKQTQKSRDEFIKAAVQMGMNKDAAGKLADELHLIPDEVRTKFETPGEREARENVAAYKRELAGVPKNKQSLIKSIFDADGVDAARAAIASLRDKDVWIRTHLQTIQTSRVQQQAGPMQARASGGPVYGPGSTTSDSFLVAMSNKEFVQSAAAHDYYGSSLMWAINQRKIPRGYFSGLGFAGGGSPSSMAPPAPAYSPSAWSQSVTVQQPTGPQRVVGRITIPGLGEGFLEGTLQDAADANARRGAYAQ